MTVSKLYRKALNMITDERNIRLVTDTPAGTVFMNLSGVVFDEDDMILKGNQRNTQKGLMRMRNLASVIEAEKVGRLRASEGTTGHVFVGEKAPENELLLVSDEEKLYFAPRVLTNVADELFKSFMDVDVDTDELDFYMNLVESGFTLDDIKKMDEEFKTEYYEGAKTFCVEHGLVDDPASYVYLYKEYCDESPYDTEITKVFATLEAAREELKK